MTGLYSETTDTDCTNTDNDADAGTSHRGPVPVPCYDTVVKCHSRNPSSGLVDKLVPYLKVLSYKEKALRFMQKYTGFYYN